jgi:hypothetical protein
MEKQKRRMTMNLSFGTKKCPIAIRFILVIALCSFIVNLYCAPGYNQSSDKKESTKTVICKVIKMGTYSSEKTIYHPDFYALKSGFLDKDKNIFILDMKSCEIFKFSPDGKFIKKVGRIGYGPGENVKPIKIVYFNDKIVVIDYMIANINIFDCRLDFIEQKKIAKLTFPFDADFINKKEFIVTSPTMPMVYKHKFFIFDFDGKMEMKVKTDTSQDGINKNQSLDFTHLSFVCFDQQTNNLWSAETGSYFIECYDSDFNRIKILKSNVVYKFEESKVGPNNQFSMRAPKDRGIFFAVHEGKIFYAYLFNDEVMLDLIVKEKSIYRFKFSNCRRILGLIDGYRLLINSYDPVKNGNSEEIEKIEIVKLKY